MTGEDAPEEVSVGVFVKLALSSGGWPGHSPWRFRWGGRRSRRGVGRFPEFSAGFPRLSQNNAKHRHRASSRGRGQLWPNSCLRRFLLKLLRNTLLQTDL